MLRRFPAVRTAWEALGKPEVRPRLANDEFEAAVTVTPETTDKCQSAGLLTARNPFLGRGNQFNNRNINILCGQIVRGEWIDGHKEVCVDRQDGRIITANHTLMAVKAAGKPVVVTARFGCDHSIEAKDGIGAQNWSTGSRIREQPIYAATAYTHYRIHFSISHPTDKLLRMWVDTNRDHLDRVVAALPKTPAGTVQPGFRQAGFVLALVEASILEKSKDPAYPGDFSDFLETMKDPIEGKNQWARVMRETVLNRTQGTPNKNKVYGITLSVLKPLMEGEKYSKVKGVRISTNTHWDGVFEKHNGDGREALNLDAQALKFASKLAAHYKVKRRDTTIQAASAALQVRFGIALDYDNQAGTITCHSKKKLDQLYSMSRQVTKYIEPFSPAAAMMFILDVHDNPNLKNFLEKSVLAVANEDWHMVCFGVARTSLTAEMRRVFDYQWLQHWFGHYSGNSTAEGGLPLVLPEVVDVSKTGTALAA